MGAKNVVPTSYYKLKKDEKQGSPSFGKLMFYPQLKIDGKWGDGKPVNCLEGYLKSVKITEYPWQDKKIENLNFELIDNDNLDAAIMFQTGLRTIVGQNILNTLAGERSLGVLTFTCGNPRVVNDKSFPTLYVNNNGNKTSWLYCKNNNNLSDIPRITVEGTGDDKVVHGQKELDNFWKGVLETHILHKMYVPPDIQDDSFNNVQGGSDTDYEPQDINAELNGNTSGPADDLPF